MEKLTVESSRLIGCIKLLNHDVHKAMLDGKLDPGLANTHKLGAEFYTNLTVSIAVSLCLLRYLVCGKVMPALIQSLPGCGLLPYIYAEFMVFLLHIVCAHCNSHMQTLCSTSSSCCLKLNLPSLACCLWCAALADVSKFRVRYAVLIRHCQMLQFCMQPIATVALS